MSLSTTQVQTIKKTGSTGLVGNVTLSEGTGVTLTQSGNDISFAASGGQTLYDAIVASSGGDYTTLGAALTAGATTIFVREGTYSESAITTATANVTIVGANPESTVIAMGANSFTNSGNYLHVENIKFTFTTGIMNNSGTNEEWINVHYSKSGNGASVLTGNTDCVVRGCKFISTQTDDVKQLQLCWEARCTVADNEFIFNNTETTLGSAVVWMNSSFGTFTGNVFKRNSSGTGWLCYATGSGALFSNNTLLASSTSKLMYADTIGVISGNTFNTGLIGLQMAGSGIITGNNFASVDDAIIADQSPIIITGNVFAGNGTTAGFTGVEILDNRDNNIIIGNEFVSGTWNTCISVAGSGADNTIILGNNFGTGNTTTVANSGTSTRSDIALAGTPAATGFSSTTSDALRYTRVGSMVTCEFVIQGTSNATSLTFTLPFTAKTTCERSGFAGLDNTSRTGVDPRIDLTATSATATVYKDLTGATWTNSGTKAINGVLVYEAA